MSHSTVFLFADGVARLGHVEDFVDWIFSYPIFPISLMLVLAIAYNLIAGGLGLVDLFWHESRWKQVLSGFFTTALVGEIVVVRYLLGKPIHDADLKYVDQVPTV